jgi:hypothetical protein
MNNTISNFSPFEKPSEFSNRSLSKSRIASKNKTTYRFFDKLKHAYCSALFLNPSDEKYNSKTIAAFFKINNIKYPSLFEDNSSKFYTYDKVKNEIVLSNNNSMNSTFIDSNNRNNFNFQLASVSRSGNSSSKIEIWAKNKSVNKNSITTSNPNPNGLWLNNNSIVSNNSNQNESLQLESSVASLFSDLDDSNELNINPVATSNTDRIQNNNSNEILANPLQINSIKTPTMTFNKKDYLIKRKQLIKNSRNLSPIREKVDESDINWYVDSVIDHRKNPDNKRKTQYLVKFISDDYFKFDDDQLEQWTNVSMMNCTTEINYYRVENNMKKIKSSKKRKYTTDITDLTASEIDFDFVNKNYITNAEHIQKRNA